jgi:hypothetical protein
MNDRKPMPIPCENCGAAIEHDRRLCSYCAGKVLARMPPLVVDESQPTRGRSIDAIDLIGSGAIETVVAWAASRKPIVSREPWRKWRGR